jgi:hypothetical protein
LEGKKSDVRKTKKEKKVDGKRAWFHPRLPELEG